MALTRKMLKALGVEEDKIEHIIEAHTETLEALKSERDDYKADAEKLSNVQKELDDLKAKGGDDYKAKYEKEHSDFEAYKSDVANKNARAAVESAYRKALADAGVTTNRIDSIMKVTDLNEMKLDKDGKLENIDSISENIKKEWSDFIETTRETGTNTPAPPTNGGGAIKTKEEIYKMENGRYVLSATERQAELAKLYQSEKGN